MTLVKTLEVKSAGNNEVVIAQDNSISYAGNKSIIIAGNNAKASVLDDSAASTLENGVSQGRINSRVKSGDSGILILYYERDKNFKIAFVGKGNIKPNTWYKLNNKGEFCESTCIIS